MRSLFCGRIGVRVVVMARAPNADSGPPRQQGGLIGSMFRFQTSSGSGKQTPAGPVVLDRRVRPSGRACRRASGRRRVTPWANCCGAVKRGAGLRQQLDAAHINNVVWGLTQFHNFKPCSPSSRGDAGGVSVGDTKVSVRFLPLKKPLMFFLVLAQARQRRAQPVPGPHFCWIRPRPQKCCGFGSGEHPWAAGSTGHRVTPSTSSPAWSSVASAACREWAH